MVAQENIPFRPPPPQGEFYSRVASQLAGVTLKDQSRKLLERYFKHPTSLILIDAIARHTREDRLDDEFRGRASGHLFERSGFLDYKACAESSSYDFVRVISPDDTLALYSAMFPERELIKDEDGLNIGLAHVSVPDAIVLTRLSKVDEEDDYFQMVESWTYDELIEWTARRRKLVDNFHLFAKHLSRLRKFIGRISDFDPEYAGEILGIDEPINVRPSQQPMKAKVIMTAKDRIKGNPSHPLSRRELGRVMDMLFAPATG